MALLASRLGIQHDVLSCEVEATGNLQSAARRERYLVLSDWAGKKDVSFIALAHTMDDQAETLLLNLSRGSGVDGLSAMPTVVQRLGVYWVRPLLQVRRAELRKYLIKEGIEWIEDPSNEDDRFDRVKVRRLLTGLESIGASCERLSATAERMQDARAVLQEAARMASADVAVTGDLEETHFNAGFWELPNETRLRLTASAIKRASNSCYRPRIAALAAGLESVRAGRKFTLAGCLLVPTGKSGFSVVRELAACGPSVAACQVWDQCWQLDGPPPPPGSCIGPLGEGGLLECVGWRSTGRLKECLVSSPALRKDGQLLAAPFAGLPNGWRFWRTGSGLAANQAPCV